MGIRSAVYEWFHKEWLAHRVLHNKAECLVSYDRDDETYFKGDVKMSVRAAVNGRLLTLQMHKPVNGPGPDWETLLYLVPEGTSLVETVATALVAAKVKE